MGLSDSRGALTTAAEVDKALCLVVVGPFREIGHRKLTRELRAPDELYPFGNPTIAVLTAKRTTCVAVFCGFHPNYGGH